MWMICIYIHMCSHKHTYIVYKYIIHPSIHHIFACVYISCAWRFQQPRPLTPGPSARMRGEGRLGSTKAKYTYIALYKHESIYIYIYIYMKNKADDIYIYIYASVYVSCVFLLSFVCRVGAWQMDRSLPEQRVPY